MCIKLPKLIAYETIDIDGEEFTLYIIEDYRQVIQPIERVVICFCFLGILILAWAGYFIYRITSQQKEEELLMKELEHEKELNKANEALEIQEHLMQKYNHSKTLKALTVVKRLTEEQGGSISVSTRVGQGIRFLLEFPRVQMDDL